LFTVEKVACLGCCTLAPVIQIDEVTYGHLTPDGVRRALRDFLELAQEGATVHGPEQTVRAGDGVAEIRVGLGSCCIAKGSHRLHRELERAVARTGARAVVKRVGCVGMCHLTPLVEVVAPGQASALYAKVPPEDADPIVARHFRPRGIARKIGRAASKALERLLTDEAREPVTRYSIGVRDEPVAAFLGKQKHLATEHCGNIDPIDIEEYQARDGFRALERCLKELTPEQVIDEIGRSGLRGRGGAGYPTGMKWASVRAASGDTKYAICNGDEGDPGAFMDRMILESYPYRVIEGMAIAAYAVGAHEGVFYIRAEYPLALQRVEQALRRCEERGILGDSVVGSGFGLRLRIMQGAGAFVCGEETALLASIEGRRGMPRLRPPYPAERGLWGKPTLVNNVETYALVPWIVRNGADAFASLGTRDSKGTKVFALAGKVARGGLVEVPMGTTVREIVEEIGGGIAGGKRFKAAQVGGPSGGCVPASLADTPVDYQALTAVGAIMGSGGLVVLDESDCMVDIARYFLEFTQDQSCGKCTYCRIGTRRMLDILERLCLGEGQKGDLEDLEQLALMVKKGSLCGLGKTAPNPVLSTLRYFRDEYEAHLQRRCPAGRCKALITYSITDDCIGCTLCAQHCPAGAIAMTPYEKHEIDAAKCVRCGTCMQVCPSEAVKVE
jgi:NADH-quinone oxidoreductase subunit F